MDRIDEKIKLTIDEDSNGVPGSSIDGDPQRSSVGKGSGSGKLTPQREWQWQDPTKGA